jgi:hypothetical protein
LGRIGASLEGLVDHSLERRKTVLGVFETFVTKSTKPSQLVRAARGIQFENADEVSSCNARPIVESSLSRTVGGLTDGSRKPRLKLGRSEKLAVTT